MNEAEFKAFKESVLKSGVNLDELWAIIYKGMHNIIDKRGLPYFIQMMSIQFGVSKDKNADAYAKFQSCCIYYCMSKFCVDKCNSKIDEKEFL